MFLPLRFKFDDTSIHSNDIKTNIKTLELLNKNVPCYMFVSQHTGIVNLKTISTRCL